jgi:hypothetical protein
MSPTPTMSHGQARDTRMQARSPRHGRTWLRVQIHMCRLHTPYLSVGRLPMDLGAGLQ